MTDLSRRHFIQTNTAALVGLVIADVSFIDFKKYKPLLSFSTIGCPDWDFETIIKFAAANNYDGIEFRGLQRELDLTKCAAFNSQENINASLKLLKEKGLKIVGLGASANLHFKDGAERKRNIDEAKRFIDLAQQLHCPYIRVFPDQLPKEQGHDETLNLISDGLKELGDYARGKNVKVLMETHGDVVHIADVKKVMELTNHTEVGLVWDIVNMWSITKEPPALAYSQLKKYIKHTHIKDINFVGGKIKHALFANGVAPIFEAIDILAKGKYKGYYSFEWEKLWAPEIEEPEIALTDYSKKMSAHFK